MHFTDKMDLPGLQWIIGREEGRESLRSLLFQDSHHRPIIIF